MSCCAGKKSSYLVCHVFSGVHKILLPHIRVILPAVMFKARRNTASVRWVFFSASCVRSVPATVNVIYLKISRLPGLRERPPPPHNAPRFDERDGASPPTWHCNRGVPRIPIRTGSSGSPLGIVYGCTQVNKRCFTAPNPPDVNITITC